ncbi:MAG: hypothetical protein Q9195_001607 [Heterodermia aff. obscurata]
MYTKIYNHISVHSSPVNWDRKRSCPGMSGSAVITALQTFPDEITIYYYFTFNDSEAAEANSFLRSILRQLLEQLHGVPNALSELYEHQQVPSVNQLLVTLLDSISLVIQPIYLVIDALDESTDQELMMESLQRMIQGCKNLRLLFTTRHHFEFVYSFKAFTAHKYRISEQKENQDIKKYISFRLQNDKRMAKWPSETKEEVLQTLSRDAAGIWVAAQLDVLRQCHNVRSIKTALKDSPKALDETYELALRRIPPDEVQDASRLLQWLCFCARPMTLLELNEVIGVDLDKLLFAPHLPYTETLSLLRTCGPLIRLEQPKGWRENPYTNNKVVRFCHESVRAYLVSNRLREFRIHFQVTKVSANACLAKTCLVYITHVNSVGILRHQRDTFSCPLLQYAMEEWPGHYRKVIGSDQQEELDNLAYKLSLLENTSNIDKPWSVNPIEVISPIYYFSLAGITGVVSMLLKEGVNPDEPPFGRWGTALGAACHAGHGDVVDLLLENGATSNTYSPEGLTPLDVALDQGREELVQLLVKHGAEVDAFHWKYGTRLQHSARSGDERAVRILLKIGADPNLYREPKPLPNYMPGNPLQEAIVYGKEKPLGHENIVKLLLAAGADPNLHGSLPDTALHWAANAGNSRIIQWLLDAGADVHATPRGDESALKNAVKCGLEEPVRLLLAAGADPNVEDNSASGTALYWAITRKQSAIEKILRDHGAIDFRETPSASE